MTTSELKVQATVRTPEYSQKSEQFKQVVTTVAKGIDGKFFVKEIEYIATVYDHRGKVSVVNTSSTIEYLI